MTGEASFVPDNFVVPRELVTAAFRLEPLGPEHNEDDYRAWMSSIDHIRSTPGMQGRSWPRPEMALADNLADLQGHASDFADRKGFTYTVLASGSGEIVDASMSIRGRASRERASCRGSGLTGPILTCPCTKPSRSGYGPPGRLPRSLTPRDEPGSVGLRPVAGLVAHSLQ